MADAEIGLIGLGVMGSNLALNIAEKGNRIAVFNRTTAKTHAVLRRGRPAQGHDRALRHDRGAGRRHPPAAAGDHHGAGRQRGRRADRASARRAVGQRHHHRCRQRQFPRHDAALQGTRRLRPHLHRHGRFGRRGRRAPRPVDHGRRHRGVLEARREGADRNLGEVRGRALRRLARHRRRRPFRQDHPQRHRICRHADDRRDLRHTARRARHGPERNRARYSPAGTRAGSTPT